MTPTGTTLDDQIRDALAEAIGTLQDSTLDPAIASPLLLALRQPDLAVDGVLRLRDDAKAAAEVLRHVADRIDRAERDEAAREPLGEAWWNASRRELENETDGARYPALWCGRWLEALAAQRCDRADQVADLAPDTAPGRRIRDRMREVSAAFAIGRRADALPALTALTTPAGDGTELLPTEVAVQLIVLRARIHLRETGDTSAALHAAREAVAAASEVEPDVSALAMAAQAEVHLERGELDAAEEVLDRARSLAVRIPDPLVLAGVLAERRGARRRFDELYDAAIDRSGVAVARPWLMRPTPANLLWRAARHVRASDPATALDLVDEALQGRIAGQGDYPERHALVDRGRILKALGRQVDAAAAYGAAAGRYAWSGLLPRAVSLYEQACALAPDDAEVRWRFAEALRVQTEDDDTVVDVALARQADRLVQDGMALRSPGTGEAWVLVTQAMLGFLLGNDDADPALLLERALLLDDGSARTYAMLATILRLSGYPAEAEAPARQGYDRDRRDPFAAATLVAVLADRDDHRGALEIVRGFTGPWAGSEMSLRAAALYLRVGDPVAALDAVAAEAPSDTVHLVRGIAHEMAGDRAAAVAEYDVVWSADAGSLRTRAWAGYRTGRLDGAVAILDELATRTPRDPSFTLDRGLMLVAQGDPDAAGRVLRDAVARCTVVEELVHLTLVDIPTVRADVERRPRLPAALSLLDEVTDLSEQRCLHLRTARRAPGSPAARAAMARTAWAAGQHDRSVELYSGLAEDGALPEAHLGLARAARICTERGDDLLTIHDDPGAAREAWAGALDAASAGLPRLRSAAGALLARTALSHLVEDDHVTAAGVLTDAFRTADSDSAAAFASALQVVARDVPSVWRIRDGMPRVVDVWSGEPSDPGEVVDGVPFRRAYRLDRAAVPDSAVFPLVTPVEVGVPARLEHLLGSTGLREGVAEVRRRVAAETGVRIPGVRVVAAPGDDIGFRIYGQFVHRMPLDADVAVDTPFLVDGIEQVVRDNLYRLISPDDVELWLDGWDDPTVEPVDGRVVDPPSRLRLVRVLRLLVREGVPITDRAAIVAGFQAAEAAGCRGPQRILRTVRRHLSPHALGRRPDVRLEAVPEGLEARVRGGLDPARPGWEMDRAEAVALADELHAWRRGLPPGVALTVRDPEIRAFVWRLLASVGSPTTVLAEEELG